MLVRYSFCAESILAKQCASSRMQTYMGLVRNPADATLIFEACRQGKLPRIQRRLSDRERNAIRSGSIFVWDEKEAGMRRWTDGKSWSASRVAGSFLTYREMEGKRAVGDIPPHPRPPGQSGEDSDENHELSDGQKYEMTESYKYKVDGLIKQSFSITTSEDQKLHLISYYGRSQPNNVHLRPPTQDPALMHIQIPRGLYPESTLELSIPPGQPGSRIEDHRYVGHAASIAPAPATFSQPAGPIYASANNLFPDGGWPSRNTQGQRPREIRPNAQAYEHSRELQHEQIAVPHYHQTHIQMHQSQQQPSTPSGTPLHLSHTPLHAQAQQQQPDHQAIHNSIHNSAHATPMFHPYGPATTSTLHEKANGVEHTPTLLRTSQPNLQYGSQHKMPPTIGAHSRGHPGHAEQIHSSVLNQTSEYGRRASLPRVPDANRRSSSNQFTSGPGPMQQLGIHAKTSSSSSAHEPSSIPLGQHISIPDLHSIALMDRLDRPVAKDIPTDKLGRWQEETRVLDVLRNAMQL